MPTATISKIKFPSGNIYEIKDVYARQLLAGGLQFVVCWDGTSTPVVANIPAGVTVTYQETEYTGTMSAENAEPLTFYLVKSATQLGVNDYYSEYAAIGETGSKSWEKLGETRVDLSNLGALAYKDNVTLNTGDGDVVLGESTTFTNSTSAVSFSGGSTDTVLGASTTFSVTNPTISVTPSTTNIKATATGTTVAGDGTANAVTALGEPSTDTFVKGVSVEKTNKMVTTSITPTNGTETVSKVTKTASKLATTTVPNVTAAGSASTWNFAVGTGDDAETLVITGSNSVAPTLGTAITVATGSVDNNGGGADVITDVSISDKNVAKVGTAVTVATGAVSSEGTGSAVVTDVSTSSSAAAITALGTPSTTAVLTGVKVTAQPTVSLAGNATAGEGVVSVATGISSATASGTAVSANSDDEVSAVTNVGTGTAAAQTITVGTNDKVTVAKKSDLSVTVS